MARLDRLNARVGARRPGLLGPAALRELLARPGPEARLELLRASAAGAALPAEPGAGPAALVRCEAALRAAREDEALRLLPEAEGRRARELLRAFLDLDEAAAVKAVVRGVAHGAPIDAILAAAPASPGLAEDVLRAAASATDLPAALDRLVDAGSTVAAAAREALPPPGRPGALAAVELAADRAAFERAGRACRRGGEDARILARHLSARVDARNAATLLLLAGAPAADCWLPGGERLGAQALGALAAAGPEAARRAVAEAFGLPEDALASPWGAEQALEAALIAPLRREARRLPLSLAVPLWYLLQRRAEVRRAALVLRGAAVGIAGEELLDLVEA